MTPSELRWLASYEEVLRVRDALNLTDRQRDIFNLKYIHGDSNQQIADKLFLSYSTVSHELVQVRDKLAHLPFAMADSLQEDCKKTARR